MAGRRNVSYAVQEDPAFIKRFKEKIGYKEDPGIEAKRRPQNEDDGSEDEDDAQHDEHVDDEKPVVVVLKPGDLTAEEAEDIAALEGHQSEEAGDALGRIMFRKPSKRSSDTDTQPQVGLIASTSSLAKKPKTSKQDVDDTSEDSKTDKTVARKQANINLLSFDEDDD